MAIRDIVTGGFGNGTFNGTIPLVVTRGYGIGAAVAAGDPSASWTAFARPTNWTPDARGTEWNAHARPTEWTFSGDDR